MADVAPLGGSTDRAARRAHGAWYTPPALVDFLVEVAAGLLAAPPRRVLDPSCGDGRVLAACAARWPGAGLHGWDVDDAALAHAAAAVPGARLTRRDVLAEPCDEAFDLVIGNPPFLGQLQGPTVLDAARARHLRARWPGAFGAYTDTAAVFLRIAADLAPVVVLVQPVSTLASRDAAAVRAHVGGRLGALWVANARVFPDALVDVAVVGLGPAPTTLRRWRGAGFEPLPPAAPRVADTWSPLIPEAFGLPDFAADTAGVLADRATATADFRDEYYALAGHVREAAPGDIPLVVSGHIDPARCLWGQTDVRLHKQRWRSPAIPADTALPGRLSGWIARRRVPKVLLATQSRVLEAVADPDGRYLPVTPVVSVTPQDPADVWRVLAVLLAPFASAWALREYGGSGFTGGAVKLSARQVCRLPLPADHAAWDAAAARLQAGEVDVAAEMDAAYGVDLAGWYAGRR